MQTTEIIELASAGERKGIRVVGVERLRSKGCLLLHHRVRNVVVIDPLDGRSYSDRQFIGREREIVDGDRVRDIMRRYRTKRQHRSKDWAQKHCNDQRAAGSKP